MLSCMSRDRPSPRIDLKRVSDSAITLMATVPLSAVATSMRSFLGEMLN